MRAVPLLIVNAGPEDGASALYALALDTDSSPPLNLSHAIPPSSSVIGFSVSPDAARVAFLASAPEIGAIDVYIVDVDGSRTKKLSPDGLANGTASLLGWSKSGGSLLFQQDTRTYVARIDGSARIEVPNRNETWTPDESEVVYVDGMNIMIAAPDGENARPLATSTAPIAMQGLSSGGGWLITASRPAQGLSIKAWSTIGAGAIDLPKTISTQFPQWSPKVEGLYAWVDPKGQAALGDVEGNATDAFEATGVERVEWSPDGKQIALSGLELVISSAVQTDAPAPIHVIGTSLTGRAPAFEWSPDCNYIAYAATLPKGTNEEVFVQAVRGTLAPEVIKMSGNAAIGSSVRSLAWSPDGRFVTYQADHRQVGTDELALTELTSDRHIVIGKVNDVSWPRDDSAWSRDGRLLAFQVDSNLTVLEAESFDSKSVEARLPNGARSRSFEFAEKLVADATR
jgi:Tol biopolymer transport system component